MDERSKGGLNAALRLADLSLLPWKTTLDGGTILSLADAAQSRLRRSLCIREAQKNVLIVLASLQQDAKHLPQFPHL